MKKNIRWFLIRSNKYHNWFETFLEMELIQSYQLFVVTGARQLDLAQCSNKSHVVRDCVSFEVVTMKFYVQNLIIFETNKIKI